jgi:hypothetical protein
MCFSEPDVMGEPTVAFLRSMLSVWAGQNRLRCDLTESSPPRQTNSAKVFLCMRRCLHEFLQHLKHASIIQFFAIRYTGRVSS